MAAVCWHVAEDFGAAVTGGIRRAQITADSDDDVVTGEEEPTLLGPVLLVVGECSSRREFPR